MGYLTRSGKIQTDILNDATPFAGANIALIKAKTDGLFWYWTCKQNNSVGYSAVAGTWAIQNNTVYWLFDILTQTPVAQNNEISIPLIAPDTAAHTLNILGLTSTNQGIITVSIDETVQGTIDMYSAGTVNNVIKTLAITPIRAGLNALRLKMATKNASSTDYALVIQGMWLS